MKTTTQTGHAVNWNLVESLEAEIAAAHKAGNRKAERAARARWELAMGIGSAPAETTEEQAIAIYRGRSIFKANGLLAR